MRKRDRREYSERYYREVAKPRVTPEQKARVLERVRARRKANPERTRNSCRASWLKKKYNWPVGLSYNAMLAVQGGLCAICRQAQTQTNKWGTRYALHVDHCHSCGVVRGLLCERCNTGIAALGDRQRLLAATDYLGKHHTDEEQAA